MLDDSAEEVAVERGAGRRIVFGNVEILSDRLGALAREKLDKVLVPDATVRSRFTGKRRPATHVRAKERSEEHTSELQSLMRISYAVFCLKKKKKTKQKKQVKKK